MASRAILVLWQFAVFASALLATGANGMDRDGRGDHPSKRAATGKTLGRVEVRVMKAWYWPANGRRVHLKDHEPVVIEDGRFAFDHVPATYELWVEGQPEAPLTVYRGLTRRDPVLIHSPSFVTALDEPSRKATISGIVRGDFPFPIDKGYRLSFYFLSNRTQGHWWMGQQGQSLGPRFGRMKVAWNGEPSITGTLVALGGHADKDKRWNEAYLASRLVELTDKGEAIEEIMLARIETGRIAGEVKAPDYRSWNGYVAFQLSGNRGEIDLNCTLKLGRYDCTVPDLSPLGGEYCIDMIDGEVGGGGVKHCGGKIGMTDFSIKLEAPPKLKALDKPGFISKTTVLAWSGDEKAVYAVDIRPDIAAGVAWFEFRLYLAGPRLAWPNIEDYGVKAPAGSKVKVHISRLFPYRSVDELAGASGPLSATVEYQRATSLPVELTVTDQ